MKRTTRILAATGFGALAAASGAGSAAAHPHIFVDARTEVAFDAAGRVAAIRHAWQFDEAFTEVALDGLDADGDGRVDDHELLPLVETNMASLAEYGFFTVLTAGAARVALGPPQDYWLEFVGGRLTLFFSLPLVVPTAGDGMVLEVGDPEYFVAFLFPEADGMTLVDPPAGCTAQFHPPGELDPQTAAALAAIPADARQLPSLFAAVGETLSSIATIDCR